MDAPQNRLQIPVIKAGIMERAAATELLGLLVAGSVYGPGAAASPTPATYGVPNAGHMLNWQAPETESAPVDDLFALRVNQPEPG